MSNDLNLNVQTASIEKSMPLFVTRTGIDLYQTVDVLEVERLKAQGWVVERTSIVLNDIVCYHLARLA